MSTQTDSKAIEDLLPRLRARARKLCRTAHEAEDIAQEAALRLWQMLSLRGGVENPDRYAMITLHNLVRQRWRSRRITEELAEDTAQIAPEAPARLACAALARAVKALPEEQLHLIEALYAGESSPKAIAARTGLPLGTVMSRLARARARLRREMGVEHSVAELL
ncbi:MAG: RNA polymerase sigma factor [Pseudomonadota bacterium]